MKLNKEQIIAKWEKMYKEVQVKEAIKLRMRTNTIREKEKAEAERLISKATRKTDTYLKKKKLEYDRKCKNEIRKLEWKEERVYKKKVKKFSELQFMLELQQENSKLRDTDSEWRGFCISCNKLKERSELAWGHRYSRSIRNICLLPENINAQCHMCNWTTWPRWDVIAKEQTNRTYDENLDKKYGKWTSRKLRELKEAYFQNPNGTTYGLPIEDMIKENEERWRSKSFYRPKKNWRKVWEWRNS